ncbi:myosin-11-like [Gossypium hirsutum]|uniref:Myosin-11-like n=1 Tax=Gossypium hirsutum TaxID=3635 RepID=A0A1U8MP32_GOSHI|nr:myosin-11-like [Gossypium hirsutum]
MKRLAIGSMITPEYNGWLNKRVNDNIPEPSLEGVRAMEKYLQVISSELEIVKRDFEERNAELGKKIEQLEEEKMHLRLDVDVQKLEAKKLRKGKRSIEEDLDSLKADYKKLQLVEGQDEKKMLVARVADLERALYQYHGCNSDIELRASLNRIEDLKGKVEEFETTLQNCELRIEFLELNNEQWKEQVRRSQDQVRDRDHIMGEALAQI